MLVHDSVSNIGTLHRFYKTATLQFDTLCWEYILENYSNSIKLWDIEEKRNNSSQRPVVLFYLKACMYLAKQIYTELYLHRYLLNDVDLNPDFNYDWYTEYEIEKMANKDV